MKGTSLTEISVIVMLQISGFTVVTDEAGCSVLFSDVRIWAHRVAR